MQKMASLRSLFRSLSSRSRSFSASINQHHRNSFARRTFFNLSPSRNPNRISQEFGAPLSMGLGSLRFYSEDVSHTPNIKDPQLQNLLKDLLAVNWSDLPDSVIKNAKAALSKDTDDKAGKDIVSNVFRAAEAVEEFGGMLTTLKMELDDSVGMSGEDVKPLPDHMRKALITIFDRYSTYLNSFGPEESFLRKKVEAELGTKMIHLKMRCSGLGSEWGKVTVLGTSGLAGSYVEQRA
ncbi:membrane anchor in succinate dehydrogenase complex [Stylosanthes scabra]|uniref:Membrane anchor in succinate dehydrogenase complex n=1 Tax=Stylosanthes scabra TaxID=79078 RepID=A0ABU6Q6K7_9FABA|nr:membrane anchor in succinate dehydrogenase complex [Stylosanthes scabra]